jgi:hypothetical protein
MRTITLVMLVCTLIVVACGNPIPPQQIKEGARKASVMPMFFRPCLQVSRVIEEVKEPPIEDVIADKIKRALEDERILQQEIEEAKKLSYRSFLTDITVYGHLPKSQTHIPIGSLAGIPKWAKFPENVLVVYKVEKKEINEWEAEYEKDVLTISETANVSPANAKQILSKLRSEGYSVSKEDIAVDEEIELLHFSTWDDTYPSTLKWSVSISGTEENIITGYDPRGILEVKPIPEDKRVDVTVGYFDLEDFSKPKSVKESSLEAEIATLKEEKDSLNKKLAETVEVPENEYDITKATLYDVIAGYVKVEQFWMSGCGSGTFLGNGKIVGKDNEYTMHNRYYGSTAIQTEMNGVVLTNAHVAEMALLTELMVSKDKETMWLIFPGIPYVRYTHTSDRLGTPAAMLWYDGEPVMSRGIDAAILVTTPLPGYEQFKASLGDSDMVEEGTAIVTAGNPGMLHKFLTEGIISNKNYNMMQSPMADYINVRGGTMFDSIVNDSMWIDTPIGMGGVSGSGVTALEGSQAGKVIAIRNAGLGFNFSDYVASELKPVDHNLFTVAYDVSVRDIEFKEIENVFAKHTEVQYTKSPKEIDGFVSAVEHGGHISFSGMNLCIPINKIKAWLVERGIDLGFRMDGEYWEK